MANRVDVMKPVLAILLFILAAGCSGVSTVPDAAPVNGRSADAAVSRQLWGLYDVAVDIQAATIEAVPLRQADLRVNVLVFLEPPPLSYLKIDFSDLEIIPPVGGADGLINVD
ncbi:MAG: hypothetical protein WBB70_00025, partial [Desulfobacterales bacterium]